MDNFTKAEISNRKEFLKWFKPLDIKGWELKETKPEDKTRFDFWLEKDGKKILIEYKARFYNKDSFKDWMIDGNKVKALRDLIKDEIIGVYYINTFKDGIAIWNLKKNIGEWKLSKPHKRYSVLKSNYVQTYDLFLTLEEAEYYE